MSNPRYDLWLGYGKIVEERVLRSVTPEMAAAWIAEIDAICLEMTMREVKPDDQPEMAQIFQSGCVCMLKPINSTNPSEVSAYFVEEGGQWKWEAA